MMTKKCEDMIDEYMNKTDAIVGIKGGKWTIDTPQQDYVYSSFDEMMNDIKINLEEIKRLEDEWHGMR